MMDANGCSGGCGDAYGDGAVIVVVMVMVLGCMV